MAQVNAILRREYGVDPVTLGDESWLRLYAEYKYTEKQRIENTRVAFKSSLIEVLNEAFKQHE